MSKQEAPDVRCFLFCVLIVFNLLLGYQRFLVSLYSKVIPHDLMDVIINLPSYMKASGLPCVWEPGFEIKVIIPLFLHVSLDTPQFHE